MIRVLIVLAILGALYGASTPDSGSPTGEQRDLQTLCESAREIGGEC